jgi:hypothetical protein
MNVKWDFEVAGVTSGAADRSGVRMEMCVYHTEIRWGNSGAFVGVSAEDIIKITNRLPSSFL